MKTRIKEVTDKHPDGVEKKYYYPQYYIGFWSWDSVRLSFDHDGRCHSLKEAQIMIDDFIEKIEKVRQKYYLESNKKTTT